MRTILLPVLLFMTLASFTTGCQDAPAANQPQTKLVITGSSTMAPLVAEIGKRFEEHHPGTRVDVQTGGSSRGILDIRRGLADIGMASRALSAEEQDLHGIAIAHDGIGLVVHQSNPVTELEDSQVIGIFTGSIMNWQEVGGRDAPITVINKAEGRATLELFLDHFNLTNSQIKAQVIIGDNEQAIKLVAGNTNTIAYVSIGTGEFDVTYGIPIKMLSLGSVPASIASVRDGGFPLARPLTLVTKTPPNGLTKIFIDFSTSPHVHDLVTQHYFVPITS